MRRVWHRTSMDTTPASTEQKTMVVEYRGETYTVYLGETGMHLRSIEEDGDGRAKKIQFVGLNRLSEFTGVPLMALLDACNAGMLDAVQIAPFGWFVPAGGEYTLFEGPAAEPTGRRS